jgi:hypothetical protein
MPESIHRRWTEDEPEQLNALITRQYVVGTNVMLARIVLKKGAAGANASPLSRADQPRC